MKTYNVPSGFAKNNAQDAQDAATGNTPSPPPPSHNMKPGEKRRVSVISAREVTLRQGARAGERRVVYSTELGDIWGPGLREGETLGNVFSIGVKFDGQYLNYEGVDGKGALVSKIDMIGESVQKYGDSMAQAVAYLLAHSK